MADFFKRYALAVAVLTYAAVLAALHAAELFPRAGLYDVSRLIGDPGLVLEGRVLDFPVTRWNQTRFLMEARASPLDAFRGRAVVTLAFPMPDLAPGDRLRLRGWLYAPRAPTRKRPFDEVRYWRTHKVFSLYKVWSWESVLAWDRPDEQAFQLRAWRFHQRFRRFWQARLPVEESALLLGMTIGARGLLPPDLKERCIRAGVYHIVVVSGQNIALVVGMGLVLLRLLRIPRSWGILLCALPTVFYCAAVGADPPVIRAAVMALVGLAAAALGRETVPYYPLLLAAAWIMATAPETLLGASFQLSFAATASLVWVFARRRPYFVSLPRWARGLLETGVLCVAAQVGVWPLLIYYFQQISLVGLFANWAVLPFCGLVMMLGLVLGVWGIVFPGTIPAFFLQAAQALVQLILKVIAALGGWSWAAQPVPAPPAWALWLYYIGLFGILFYVRQTAVSRR